MKGWHYIAADLSDGWMLDWLEELLGWPARFDAWLRGEA